MCFAFVLWCYGTPAYSSPSYYRSNAGGMNLGSIPQSARSAHEYILAIETRGNTTSQVLLHLGREVSRIERTIDLDSVVTLTYLDGVVVSELISNESGPLEEKKFLNGNLVSRTAYSYSRDRLSRVEVLDPEGDTIESIEYLRTNSGRVYRSIYTGVGVEIVSLYRFAADGLYESWLGSLDSGSLYRTQNGVIDGIERWEGAVLVRRMIVEETETGSVRTTEEFTTGTTTVEIYGSAAQLLESYSDRAGIRLRTERFRYEEDRLTEKTTVSGRLNEQTRYSYSENGDLSEEELFQNSKLVKRTVYSEDETRFEELFRDGSPILRVYFDGDRKISEEPL